MAKATWGGKVIAESNATVVVEGNQYFPAERSQKGIFEAERAYVGVPVEGNCALLQRGSRRNEERQCSVVLSAAQVRSVGDQGSHRVLEGRASGGVKRLTLRNSEQAVESLKSRAQAARFAVGSNKMFPQGLKPFLVATVFVGSEGPTPPLALD